MKIFEFWFCFDFVTWNLWKISENGVFLSNFQSFQMQKRRADERKLSLGKTIQSVPSNVQMKAAPPVSHSSYSFLDIMGKLIV